MMNPKKMIFNTRTVAFDPGGTTGYAIFENGKIKIGDFVSFEGIDNVIENKNVVIFEKPFNSPIVDVIVFYVSGAICERGHSKECQIISQKPSIKNYIEDRYSLNKEIAGSIHGKEALAHLFYYLIVKHGYSYEDVLGMVDNEHRKRTVRKRN